MGKKKFKIIGFLFLLFGFNFFFLSNFIYKSVDKKELEKVENFIANSSPISEQENFLGVLEIPKIKLKRGFYELTSKQNNVNQNIEVIETSLLPDNAYSNLILASHSGNSRISYFKNLDQLELEDEAYIYYNERKYFYKLINIYSEEKDGTIAIRRANYQTNLTLITCDKKNKTLQNVYIFKLISD